MCHLSHVTCHVSCVKCHVSHVEKENEGQRGGASRWRVCYQRGLLRLVFIVKGLKKVIIYSVLTSFCIANYKNNGRSLTGPEDHDGPHYWSSLILLEITLQRSRAF